jgi:predicted transposase/invertase (TIGR01784 family)
MIKNDWYDHIKKVICIVITDFNLIAGGDSRRYHHRFRQHDEVDDTYFGDAEEIHTLELRKLPLKADESGLWEWGKYFSAKEEEDLLMVREKNKELDQAVETLMELSADREVRREYERREKARMDALAREDWVRKEEKQGIVRNAFKKGLSLDVISDITGLDIETIKSITGE